jgi:arabinogalactan oligomer/maltooligosaccharide transport system substrate-binding protein
MRKAPIIIAVLALVAAACSGGSAEPTTTTTTVPPVVLPPSTSPPSTFVIEPDDTTTSLEIWAPDVLVEPLEAAAAGFEIETGIDVEITTIEIDDTLDRLLADPDGGPDIYVAPHAWLTTLTRAGLAEPLTVDPSVVDGATAGVTLRGVTYAAPIGLDTLAQFRDPDLLGSSPATVEAFADGCTAAGSTGPCLTLSASSVIGHWPFITAAGGYLFGPDEFDGWNAKDVGIDSPEALTGALVLEDVVAGAGILGDGDATARQRFVAGQAPLFWGTTADLTALRQAGASFVVEQLPTIAGQPSAGPVEVVALWVNAFSVDKEAAVELVEDHLAVPESARALAVALGLAPVDAEFDADQDLRPFTLAARIGSPLPPIEATELARTELQIAFEAIRGGEPAEIALGGAASSLRAGA